MSRVGEPALAAELIDRARFLRPYIPRRLARRRRLHARASASQGARAPGGIVNGPSLMAAADCAMWLAIKGRFGDRLRRAHVRAEHRLSRSGEGRAVYCTARILKVRHAPHLRHRALPQPRRAALHATTP
jgi:acyl-coenzyme A thioesterase PaaI-like protein